MNGSDPSTAGERALSGVAHCYTLLRIIISAHTSLRVAYFTCDARAAVGTAMCTVFCLFSSVVQGGVA